MTFTTIVIANLSLILITRSWSAIAVSGVRSPNPALLLVFAGTPLCLSLVLLGPLSPFEILISGGAGVLSVVWFEVYKYGGGGEGVEEGSWRAHLIFGVIRSGLSRLICWIMI